MPVERRTLLVNGREVDVALVPPLCEGSITITDDFGAMWTTHPNPPVALIVSEATGPAVEVGHKAGNDIIAPTTAAVRRGRRK